MDRATLAVEFQDRLLERFPVDLIRLPVRERDRPVLGRLFHDTDKILCRLQHRLLVAARDWRMSGTHQGHG